MSHKEPRTVGYGQQLNECEVQGRFARASETAGICRKAGKVFTVNRQSAFPLDEPTCLGRLPNVLLSGSSEHVAGDVQRGFPVRSAHPLAEIA